MPKTITLRLDDKKYKLFKIAAESESRTISNLIEHTAYLFMLSENYVSDFEMKDILSDKKLVSGLKKGISDIKSGRYRIVD